MIHCSLQLVAKRRYKRLPQYQAQMKQIDEMEQKDDLQLLFFYILTLPALFLFYCLIVFI